VVGVKGEAGPAFWGQKPCVCSMKLRRSAGELMGICGTENDRSVPYRLGRSTSPMAVAVYTHERRPWANNNHMPIRTYHRSAGRAELDAHAEAEPAMAP
jgi:hypothetical protein